MKSGDTVRSILLGRQLFFLDFFFGEGKLLTWQLFERRSSYGSAEQYRSSPHRRRATKFAHEGAVGPRADLRRAVTSNRTEGALMTLSIASQPGCRGVSVSVSAPI